MNIEGHKRAVRESLETIKESIQRGVTERQRTIGFHCSVAAADMLELFLHKQNLIDPGASVKHDFFTSKKKAGERLSFKFENKDKLIDLLVELENRRNLLCYGKPQPKESIQRYVSLFNKIKKVFDEMGVKYE